MRIVTRLVIARRAFADHRRALVWWVLGVGAYVAFIVAFYPTVRDEADRFNELISSYPKGMMDLFLGGQTLDFSSPASFVNTYLFASMVPIMILVLAISRGAAAIAGEEESGTLDLVLAQPVRRRRFVAEKALVLAVEVAVVGAVTAVVLLVGGPAVELHLAVGRLVLATLGLVLLAVVFGFVALVAGAATGRRGRSTGIATTLAAATYLVNGMSGMATWLEPLRPISPFWWATRDNPVAVGLSITQVAVLVVMALVMLGAATIAFDRRDLGT